MVKTSRTPYSAKFTKIACRYCKQKINRQSYRDHLKNAHNDTSGNLREYGSQDIRNSLFGQHAVPPSTGISSEVGEGGDNEVVDVVRSRSNSRSRSPHERQRVFRSRSREPRQRTRISRSLESTSRRGTSRSSSRSSWSRGTEQPRIGDRAGSRSSSSDSSSRVTRREVLEEEIEDLKSRQEWITDTMQQMAGMVERLVANVGIEVDVRDCNHNGFEELLKKIDAVNKYLETKENVKGLDKQMKQVEKSIKKLNMACSSPQPAEVEEVHVPEIMKKCHSIRDIENRFGEFEYNLSKGEMQCVVCEKVASSYGEDLQDDFSGMVMSTQFRNLKVALRKHLEGSNHQKIVTQKKVQEKLEDKVQAREKKIGLVLGDVAFYLLKLGRPNTDFPYLVNILARAGVDVGDINHSSEFIANWAGVCGKVVEGRVRKYFQTELIQTGRRPPSKAICDKATWKHETRMVSGLVTVVPDSQELLQAFFTGSKSCPGGTGREQVASLVPVYDCYITGSQV